ncbi:Tyrosine specific protein phosphatase and dual specificity protein phosphatase [Trichoderma parareesei]|uniref:Tyrosine specific protein phosphatase and dual specificity protein phosphatase n=1 Tax=Trichoderma parareesei TaxID=858221 RepID=A0A2H2ZL55_TRIPA|nr:Tyrosine specific protein phosphatase and dual specificity protein phosphatase [Trichoderma parareesei]
MPPAPYICIPGVPNFRDIGGQPLSSQPTKQVRRNTVFRSGRPTIVLDRGVKKLKMLAITHMFDLRSRQELTSARYDPATMLWPGTERVSVPVFRPEEYAGDGGGGLVGRFDRFGTSVEGPLESLSRILLSATHPQNASRPYARILQHLSSPSPSSHPPSPILIHCDLGQDRTAVICALVLSLCGVSDDLVAHEYSLTDVELACHHKSLADKVQGNPAFKGTREDAEALVLSRKENMLCFLKKLRQKHGSIEKCVINHDLLQAEGIARLRRNMIVDAAKNHCLVGE